MSRQYPLPPLLKAPATNAEVLEAIEGLRVSLDAFARQTDEVLTLLRNQNQARIDIERVFW